jgi:hypothetical protein
MASPRAVTPDNVFALNPKLWLKMSPIGLIQTLEHIVIIVGKDYDLVSGILFFDQVSVEKEDVYVGEF